MAHAWLGTLSGSAALSMHVASGYGIVLLRQAYNWSPADVLL